MFGEGAVSGVFPLWHVRRDDEHGDDAKFIGVYSSHEAAKEAVGRLEQLPGFADHPAGFQVEEYQLDEDHWTEGFRIDEDEPVAAHH